VTYLLRRGGPNALRRKAHLARYDQFGNIAASWCGRPYNLTSNVPWGLPRCKDCTRKAAAAAYQTTEARA
jgi:hypothetical protein